MKKMRRLDYLTDSDNEEEEEVDKSSSSILEENVLRLAKKNKGESWRLPHETTKRFIKHSMRETKIRDMDGKDTGRRIDKISRDAVCVLINECEFLLNNRFSLAKHMTKHRNRVTLEEKDMHLLDKLEEIAHSNRLKTMRRHDRIEKAAALKSEKKSLLARKQQQQIKKKKKKNKKEGMKKKTPPVINNASRKRKRTEKEIEIEIEKEDAIEPQLTKKMKINTINQNVVEAGIDTESSSSTSESSSSSESSEYDEDAEELRKIKEMNNELLLYIEKEVEVEQEREDEEGAFCYEPLSTEY